MRSQQAFIQRKGHTGWIGFRREGIVAVVQVVEAFRLREVPPL